MKRYVFLSVILFIFCFVGGLVLFSKTSPSSFPLFKIELYGDRIMNIDEIFEEPGFSAFDEKDGDITNQVVVEDFIDYRVKGTYEVKYSVKNSRGELYRISRFVILDKPLN